MLASAPFQQTVRCSAIPDAGVVPGGYVVGVQEHGTPEQEVELDFVIARETGMRSPAPVILFDEIVDDVGLKLALEVLHVVGDADGLAHPAGVLDVLYRAAPLAVGGNVVALHRPQAHGDANDLVALLLQQQGSHGGVHAPAHRDYDPSLAHAMSAKKFGFPHRLRDIWVDEAIPGGFESRESYARSLASLRSHCSLRRARPGNKRPTTALDNNGRY